MFVLYTLLLMLSGIALVVLGAVFRDQGVGSRILNVVVGLAFFGYGFYLLFLFPGGTYRIFLYAFVVPVLLIVQAVKARNEAKQEAEQQRLVVGPQGGAAAGYGVPPQSGQYGVPPQSAQYGVPPQSGQYGQPGQPAPQGSYGPQAQPGGYPAPQGQAYPGPQGYPAPQAQSYPGQPQHGQGYPAS
ncbi:hypothetical protein V6U81_21920 [Micromonospora sp. CPCC 205711]|uniref:hypothetical protein n=1 Tax=Micromonospora sp. CPCC 205547 TaxID=3122400 RepID=UPI002FF35355